MTLYTIICYSEDGSDYCRGCHMGSWSSRFETQTFNDLDEAHGYVAARLLEDKIGNPQDRYQYTCWEITILVDGKDTNWYPDDWRWDEDPDPEHIGIIANIRTEGERRAQLAFEQHNAKIAEKKAAEERRKAELAVRVREQKDKEDYERLRAKFERTA